MKIGIVNGSPKGCGSASEVFCTELKNGLGKVPEIMEYQWNHSKPKEEEVESLLSCDRIVFVFPLYVDGIPSHLLIHLEELERILHVNGKGKEIQVYSIINCGFYEGIQTKTALDMIKNWSSRLGISWGMGMGIGGGPMLYSLDNVPLGKGPKKSMGKAYSFFISHILYGSSSENMYVNPSFPRRLYIMAAHMGFVNSAKQNGIVRKEMYQKI